jgi:hypothetical protein
MPLRPHHHRHHRGPRGPRSVVVYPTAYEESVFLDTPEDIDILFVPPTDDPEPKIPQAGMTFFENDEDAGDILPTFVTPEDAKRYLNEVDGGYSQLDTAIQSSPLPPLDFKTAWGLQLASWKAFYGSAMATVGWLNTKAVMDQTDRFQAQLIDWRKSFSSVGGTPPGPAPLPPGQGVPGSGNPTSDIVKSVAAVGAVAAIIIFGPALVRSFSH